MDIQLKGKTKGTEIEINDSYIRSASDEQLAEVREHLVQAIIFEPGAITVSTGTLLVVLLLCVFFSFKVVAVLLCMVYVAMVALYYASKETMKHYTIQIDAELARRKQ